jgi:hypothetical protein
MDFACNRAECGAKLNEAGIRTSVFQPLTTTTKGESQWLQQE